MRMYGLDLQLDEGIRPAHQHVSAMGPFSEAAGTAAAETAVAVTVRFAAAAAPKTTRTWLRDDEAGLDIAERLRIVVRRASPLAVELAGATAPDEAQIVHPLGAFIGAVIAHWQGWVALHGAAVIVDGACLVVLGGPGAGKSTLCSALLARGHQVLSDDLSVLDGSTVFAGPPSLDLRSEASGHLSAGVPLAGAVGRERFRVALGDRPHEASVAGFVELGWGTTVEARRAAAPQRLAILAANQALVEAPARPVSLLRLVGRPFWAVERPRTWGTLPRVVEHLERLATDLIA